MTEYKVPYQFIAGTRARASQVNANFEYVAEGLTNLDENKANISGDSSRNFSVAEPVSLHHATTKRYVDLALANAGGGGNGVGKSVFEVFHTLSTKTPSGAFSLRTGELILDAESMYASFWLTLQEEGSGLIPDFSMVSELPEGYNAVFDNIDPTFLDPSRIGKVFSPYSWLTVPASPTHEEPFVAELELEGLMTCTHFKLNSHVFNTYDSVGEASAQKAVKVASISVRQADGTWVPVAIINDSKMPTANSRYYKNEKPLLEFNAMRIVIAENFGANSTDISLYPADPSKTTVRVVPEEQWQWEVEHYRETGSFVMDDVEKTIRLPKVNRVLTGVSELWEIGVPEVAAAGGGNTIDYDDAESSLLVQESSDTSINLVGTGLWIQVYNGVVEDALSNVRYIPHAQLFQEETFRFIPPEESGFYVCDGSWRDGAYFEDAMTLLINQYAQAVNIPDTNYKLAPNGMRFVTEDVYTSTYNKYGEVPYYVLDSENTRFKTPMSNNYIRCSNTIDNVGDILQDGAPNIKASGFLWRTGATLDSQVTGALYVDRSVNNRPDSADAENNGPAVYFDASRCSNAYGRSEEVQVKSSYQVLCVFLGNEVPQSSSVDLFKRVKACESRMDEILEGQGTVEELITSKIGSVETSVSSIESIVSDHTTSIDSLILEVNAQADKIDALRTDLDDVIQRLVSMEERMTAIESRADSIEVAQQNIQFSVDGTTLSIEDL